jgi:heme-degrading monooxygenase HmoA
MSIAKTPEPPYYAVIFTNLQTADLAGYEKMADRMVELAQQQPGYLGMESVRNGLGITVSYWATMEDIKNWKNNLEHMGAQKAGRMKWYESYAVRICKVEHAYDFAGL